MSWATPLPAPYRRDLTRHVRALRRAGYTWAEVAMLTGAAKETCRKLGKPPPLFGTVTRVGQDGGAMVVRVGL